MQLLAIAESLSLTIPLVIDPVDNLAKPARPQMCVHMVDSERCAAREGGIYPSPCSSEDDLKYRVVRVAVNAVQLQLVENTTALEIKVYFLAPFLLWSANPSALKFTCKILKNIYMYLL